LATEIFLTTEQIFRIYLKRMFEMKGVKRKFTIKQL